MTTPIKALLIGEAFGAKEELFSHGFVGPSGRELGKMLAAGGVLQSEPDKWASELEMIKFWKAAEHQGIAIANVFDVRPQDNNIELFFTSAAEGDENFPPFRKGNATKYVRLDMAHHVEKLWQKIAALKPNLIVCLGNTASWAVLGKTTISQIRGTIDTSLRFDTKVICTYHPAGVMRQWNTRTVAIADFVKCAREMEYTDIRRTERWILVEPTLDEIESWFNEPADSYAVDIESGRALYENLELKRMAPAAHHILNRHISMIGFARDRHNAIVIPFMTRAKPSLNYWDREADEIRALQLCQRALAKPIPKIFQNGLYDIPMLWSYGLRPRNCTEDTMLLHHSLYSELPKKLSFLASIYEDEREWKSMYKHGENLKRED